MDFIYEKILELIEISEVEEHKVWETFYTDNFIEINYIFNSLNENQSFKRELLKKGYSFEIEMGQYSNSSLINFKLINNKREIHTQMISNNIPKKDVTLFTGEAINGPIYFIIDHLKMLLGEEKYCYIYHKPKKHQAFDLEEEKFWEIDSYKRNKKCKSTFFDIEKLKEIIQMMI